MLARAASVFVLALPLLAAATALPRGGGGGGGCSSGSPQCCNTTTTVSVIHRLKQIKYTNKLGSP